MSVEFPPVLLPLAFIVIILIGYGLAYSSALAGELTQTTAEATYIRPVHAGIKIL